MKKRRSDIRINVKISPRLQWVITYLKKAKAKMPSLIMPAQIRSFKPTERKIMRVFGNVYFESRIIVLATHNQQTYVNKKGQTRVKKIVAISHPEILSTLAHELAHLHYPDHDYEHEEFTPTIFKTFDITQKCLTCKGTGRISTEIRP